MCRKHLPTGPWSFSRIARCGNRRHSAIGTAPVLKTQDYLLSKLDLGDGSDLEKIRSLYIRAFRPASFIKRNLRLLAGCRNLSDVFGASGFVGGDAKLAALSHLDIAILAQDAQGRPHRAFIEPFMEFYESCYLKHLAPKGVSLAVIGDLGVNVRLPGVLHAAGVKDPGPILAAARVILAPWSDLAVLHPAIFWTMLHAIAAGKPLVS